MTILCTESVDIKPGFLELFENVTGVRFWDAVYIIKTKRLLVSGWCVVDNCSTSGSFLRRSRSWKYPRMMNATATAPVLSCYRMLNI